MRQAHQVNFRLKADDKIALERIRQRLVDQAPPGMKDVTITDALRFAVATTSAALPPDDDGTFNPAIGRRRE